MLSIVLLVVLLVEVVAQLLLLVFVVVTTSLVVFPLLVVLKLSRCSSLLLLHTSSSVTCSSTFFIKGSFVVNTSEYKKFNNDHKSIKFVVLLPVVLLFSLFCCKNRAPPVTINRFSEWILRATVATDAIVDVDVDVEVVSGCSLSSSTNIK